MVVGRVGRTGDISHPNAPRDCDCDCDCKKLIQVSKPTDLTVRNEARKKAGMVSAAAIVQWQLESVVPGGHFPASKSRAKVRDKVRASIFAPITKFSSAVAGIYGLLKA